jgi:hypothetical protein
MAHAEGNLCTIAAKAEWRSSVLGSEDALQAKLFTASGNVNGGGFRNGTLYCEAWCQLGKETVPFLNAAWERQRQRITAEAQRTQRKAKDLMQRAQKRGGERRENGRDPRLWRGRHEAKAPSSLRKITQGRQDDDACRIVRKFESTAGSGRATWEIGVSRNYT